MMSLKMESSPLEPPLQKRIKRMERWEDSIYGDNADSSTRKSLGLADLFGRDTSCQSNRNDTARFGGGNGEFFTLRVEHRRGGLGTVSHKGEERLLLFRSDRPGCVGKLIFSSQPAKYVTGGENSAVFWKNQTVMDENWCEKKCEFDPVQMDHMAQAKIHVLDVKEEFRGRDLGGLLFSEAIASLRERYNGNGYDDDVENSNEVESRSDASWNEFRLANHPSVLCQLDAEEDTRRHNKLIHFYEDLGCHVKPHAKIRYLNNNDGETYRKIPMHMAVRGLRRGQPAPKTRESHSASSGLVGSLGESQRSFLSVQLLEANGKRVCVSTRDTVNGTNLYGRERRLDWIIMEGDDGVIFRTTHGRHLCAEPGDRIVADRLSSDKWESFRLRRVPDTDRHDDGNESCSDCEEIEQKRLFTLQTSHGSFLTIDPESHSLSCSGYPVFWVADDKRLSLTCTLDTPLRRRHYRKTWCQGVSFVRQMHEKYLGFQLKKIGIRGALQLAKHIPCHRFHVKGTEPSLRSSLFYAAEIARQKGHPDWVQLIALVHGLARVVTLFDEVSVGGYDDYNWTLTARSRVVGCAPPTRVNFREYRGLDPDAKDDQYKTQLGIYERNCGMEHLLLTWTGPEYMYFLLKENDVSVPEEGLAMLRLFPLSDWHTHDEYGHLVTEYDTEMMPLVQEFDEMIRRAKRTCRRELSDDECNRLWDEYYLTIFEKYNCDDELCW